MRKVSITFILTFLVLLTMLTTTVFANGLLVLGSRGAEVRQVQQRLNELGFDAGAEDGVLGYNTQTAIKKFQTQNSLTVDGIVGPQTWEVLYSNIDNIEILNNDFEEDTNESTFEERQDNTPLTSNLSAPITETLRYGNKGNQVKLLQNRLNELDYNTGTPDGVFGAKTFGAVITFQRINGLAVDGIAGAKTVECMYNNPISYSKELDTDTGSDIVSFAMLYLGKPYVYAATGPNAFDCSGFTYFVYKNFGITIPRSSYNLGGVGMAVTKSELVPGDLILFTGPSSGTGIGHVGIYIGNGNFIHASSGSSMSVKIDTILSGSYNSRYIGARRLL